MLAFSTRSMVGRFIGGRLMADRARGQSGGAVRRRFFLGAMSGLLAVSTGCGMSSSLGGASDPSNSSVGRFVSLVERYRIAQRGRLPSNEQELRTFATTIHPDDLKALGVTSVDECFGAGRDGQPLVVLLGQKAPSNGDPSVICYEQEGQDGIRLVGKLGGSVEVADTTRFAELVPTP